MFLMCMSMYMFTYINLFACMVLGAGSVGSKPGETGRKSARRRGRRSQHAGHRREHERDQERGDLQAGRRAGPAPVDPQAAAGPPLRRQQALCLGGPGGAPAGPRGQPTAPRREGRDRHPPPGAGVLQEEGPRGSRRGRDDGEHL